MKTTTLPLKYSINRGPYQLALLLILLALACFALSPKALAVCQEGCLGDQNTVLGDDALINNGGIENTAIGFQALFSNTGGYDNTADGAFALHSNTTGNYNTATGARALLDNITGRYNTATGANSLLYNTTGF